MHRMLAGRRLTRPPRPAPRGTGRMAEAHGCRAEAYGCRRARMGLDGLSCCNSITFSRDFRKSENWR